MSLYSPLPIWQQSDGNGRPYAGGLLYTYDNGTTTPKQTFDAAGAVNTNPVVFDSAGRASIRLDTGSYSMTFTDGVGATVYDPAVVEGVVVWTKDGIGYSDSIGVFSTADTIAALRAMTFASASFVIVKDYATAGDGGGGIFYWDSVNTSSDDYGVIIKPTGYTGSSGRWHRQFSGNVKARWFGAKADGTDDATYLARAIAYATYYLTEIELDYGTYTLASDPGFTLAIPIIMGDAILKWSGFIPTINPLIPVSDTRRHFYYGVGEAPVFAADTTGAYAEIKNVWMNGLTYGWYQSSIVNDQSAVNLTLTNSITTQVNNLDTTTAARDATMASHITLLNGSFADSTTLATTVKFLDSTATDIPVTVDTTSTFGRYYMSTKYVNNADTTTCKVYQQHTYIKATATDVNKTVDVAEVRFDVDAACTARDSSMMYTALNSDGSNSLVCPVKWYDTNTLSIGQPSSIKDSTQAITNGILALTNWPSPGGAARLKSITYGDFSAYTITLNVGAVFGSETITWAATGVTINYTAGLTTVDQMVAKQGTAGELGTAYKWGSFSTYNNGGAVIVQVGTFAFSSMSSIAFTAGTSMGISKKPFLPEATGAYKFYTSIIYEGA
jgi:hypothetical protein